MLSSLELCSLLPDTLVVLSSASSYLKGSGMVCVSIKFDEATGTTGTGVVGLFNTDSVACWIDRFVPIFQFVGLSRCYHGK